MIWFSYSPNRLLYDLKEWKLKNAGFIKSLLWRLHIFLFYNLDQHIVRNNFNQIVAQSETVRERIFKYYQKTSMIIYSPLDVKKYKFKAYENYFLAVSRFTIEKRMNVIAESFKKMGDKNIVMVGDGPLKNMVEQLVRNCKNITFLSIVSEEKLIELYSKCMAVIYMPKDEDFGLVPLESMASGKVCIAANEGGCKETVINNKTGYLIKPTVEEIVKAVQRLNLAGIQRMRNDCKKQAKKFDITECTNQWVKLIK